MTTRSWSRYIQRTALGCSLLTLGAQADDAKLSSPANTNFPPAKAYGSPHPGTVTTKSDQLTAHEFVHKAAIGGQKEVLLSSMALQRSANSEIQQFARRLVQDHSQANQELMRIAQTKGIEAPATNAFELAVNSSRSASTAERIEPDSAVARTSDPDNRRGAGADSMGRSKTAAEYRVLDSDLDAARKLDRLSGAEFDRAYVKEMTKDHDKTVSLFESASKTLDDAELQAFASSTLPKLLDHYRMAQDLAERLRAFTLR